MTVKEFVDGYTQLGSEQLKVKDVKDLIKSDYVPYLEKMQYAKNAVNAVYLIDINGEKVGAPFVIKAIGNPEGLYGAIIMPGSYYSKMKEDGVQVSITKENSLVIPKYNGTYKYEYATIIE